MKTLVPGLSKSRGSVLFNNGGEINASCKADAITKVKEAIELLASGKFEDKATIEANVNARRERTKALVEASTDKSGHKMAILAEAVTSEVLDQTNRDGFARRFLQFKPLESGDLPYVTMRDKQAIAYAMSSESRVIPVEARERRQILNEFSITSEILITNMEIQRSPNDLLEEKYDECLEALMVTEDRFWKKLADVAATSRYNVQSFMSFTPQIFARMINIITNEGLPPSTLLISSNLYQDIISGSEFQQVFDPVTQYEVLQTGEIGQMYGVNIVSDAVRGPNMRVLEAGDLYAIASPEYHGVMHARNLITEPINTYNQGQSKRGWFFDQITSMMVANTRSIVKGKRLANS
jgi:hypothetical protein